MGGISKAKGYNGHSVRFAYLNDGGTDSFIQQSIDNHVAYVYEDICREKMWEFNEKGTWPFYFSKVGRYWDSKVEIDICAIDSEGKNLIVGECKYLKEKMGINVLASLEDKASSIEWNKNSRHMWYVLCSVNGYSDELLELSKSRKDIV